MLQTNSIRLVLALCAGLVLCGCQQTSSGVADEEKEPQFLIGRNQVNAMNFSGAIEAFERALEMNPRSSAAHFELGWLYAEKQTDEAAAIYHYQQYLKLHPGANNAEMIQQHILRLKQELARAALPIPPSSDIQRQMENLAAENRRLQGEVDQLRRTLAQSSESNRPVAGSSNVSRVSNPATSLGVATTVGRPVTSLPDGGASARLASNAASSQSHRVKPGETPASIARQYRVSLDALLGVNPGLNPKRIQIGQSIMLPRH
jgi:LysM repeat protein